MKHFTSPAEKFSTWKTGEFFIMVKSYYQKWIIARASVFWRIIVSLVICTLFRHSKIWIHFLKMMMQVYVNIYLLWCLFIVDLEYVHWYSFNFQRTVMIIVSYHVFFSKVLIIFYALKCRQFSFFFGNLTFLVKNCKIFFSVYAHIYIVLKISACSIEFII